MCAMQRLVVFEVINLKPSEGGSHDEQITRGRDRDREAVTRGRRSRQARDPGTRCRPGWSGADQSGLAHATGSSSGAPGCRARLHASPCDCERSSAHHWARKLAALGKWPPASSRRNWSSPTESSGARAARTTPHDAAAICEAASRPTMRFIPVKSVDAAEHAVACTGCAKELTGRSHRLHAIAIRGLLAEFGLVFPQSPRLSCTAVLS